MAVCPKCGFYNALGKKYCVKCNTRLTAQEAQASPPLKPKNYVPEAIHLKAGDVISGRKEAYRILKFINEGGFGTVYQVEAHQKLFALKIIKLRNVMPEDRHEVKSRFKREYEAGQVKSDYLVHSVDRGELKGNPFLVMDYCPNGSLRNFSPAFTHFSEAERVSQEILQGLHDLHTSGIIHKDLKPENVLLDPYNQIKIADFGIAGFINNRMTQRNWRGMAKNVFGTLKYAPPEQLDRGVAFKAMGPTNDIFAFGVIMYELLSGGYLPFGTPDEYASDIQVCFKRIKKGKYIRITKHKKEVPSHWEDIIYQCIAPKPVHRFQSAEVILQKIGSPPRKIKDFKSSRHGKWVLRVMNGEEVQKVYDLSLLVKKMQRNILRMGWLNSEFPMANDINIKETHTRYVSSYHATLEYYPDDPQPWLIKDGQWRVKDGKEGWHLSTNGVLVNSREVNKYGFYLTPGDIITLGDTTLRIEIV